MGQHTTIKGVLERRGAIVTDLPPLRGKSRCAFEASDRQDKINIPHPAKLEPLFKRIVTVRDTEDGEKLRKICTRYVDILSRFYKVVPPKIKLLIKPRPHSTREGQLASELFGDYHIKQSKIRIWAKTPMKGQWTAPRTILNTLCHEFMHHLDLVYFDFSHSFHTRGFFERAHKLYLATIGETPYPLQWLPSSKFENCWILSWQGTTSARDKAVR
ncbi:MAG TPA: hypothetical protein VNH15_06325 [Elusimicrobiota bacterium]|nr:hypothetical protein [Elusimicrobiota bacterium]